MVLFMMLGYRMEFWCCVVILA